MSTRGIRNNNPGNIRRGPSPWLGLATREQMTDRQKDEKEFEVFVSAVYGIRALAKLLLNYQRRYRLYTVAEIIERYAPANENDVRAYVNHVAAMVDVDPYDRIDLSNFTRMYDMVLAVIRHENGEVPYDREIEDGVRMALEGA